MFPNVKKEMKKMEKHLKGRPDEKIIEGYKQAKYDYEQTNDEQIKMAMDIIKKEIDRRGLKVE